jgi:hypothetical protein
MDRRVEPKSNIMSAGDGISHGYQNFPTEIFSRHAEPASRTGKQYGQKLKNIPIHVGT